MDTRLAFDDAVERRGPNDFFTLKKGIETVYGELSLERLLGWLRLSGWDHNIFLGCFPDLMDKVAEAPEGLKAEVAQAAQRVWETYFPLREPRDLAFHLGVLLLAVERPEEALELFSHSLRLYGEDPETHSNMALCREMLAQRGGRG